MSEEKTKLSRKLRNDLKLGASDFISREPKQLQ